MLSKKSISEVLVLYLGGGVRLGPSSFGIGKRLGVVRDTSNTASDRWGVPRSPARPGLGALWRSPAGNPRPRFKLACLSHWRMGTCRSALMGGGFRTGPPEWHSGTGRLPPGLPADWSLSILSAMALNPAELLGNGHPAPIGRYLAPGLPQHRKVTVTSLPETMREAQSTGPKRSKGAFESASD